MTTSSGCRSRIRFSCKTVLIIREAQHSMTYVNKIKIALAHRMQTGMNSLRLVRSLRLLALVSLSLSEEYNVYV